MSVSTTTTKVTYPSGGTTFPVPFPFFLAGDLYVTVGGSATTAFTVSGNPRTAAASVVLSAATSSAVVIERRLALVQPVTLPTAGQFSPATHEGALDRGVMQAQDQARDAAAALAAETATRAAADASEAATRAAADASEAATRAAADQAIIDAGVEVASTSSSFVQATGGNTSLTLADWMAGVVNAKSFGAQGDGSTDDTAALQNAIDFCFGAYASPNGLSSTLNRQLFIPHGTYRITDSLKIRGMFGGKIYGEGRFATKIVQETANKQVFYVLGAGYSKFTDMYLGQTGAGGAALFLLLSDQGTTISSQSNTFENIYFEHDASYPNVGLQLGAGQGQVSENVISNCFFSKCSSGLLVNDANALQNIVIGGNYQACTTGINVAFGSVTNIFGVGFQNDKATDDQTVTGGWDILLQNSSTDQCVIEGCRTESLQFLSSANSYNVTLIGNTVIPSRLVARANSTAYALGKCIAVVGYAYKCTTAGTSDSSAPTFEGAVTVTDGTVEWTRMDHYVVSSDVAYLENNIFQYGRVASFATSQMTLVRNYFTRPDFFSGASAPYIYDSRSPVMVSNFVRQARYQGGAIVAQTQEKTTGWQPLYIGMDLGRTALLFRGYGGHAVGFERGRSQGNSDAQNTLTLHGTLAGAMAEGTDVDGSDLYLGGGPGTGSGTGGDILFFVTQPGASGTAVRDYATAAQITAADKVLNVVGGYKANGAFTVDAQGYTVTKTALAAAIADKANAINTTGKAAGRTVFDTTNGRLMIATGATDVSTWKSADGATTVTPA